MGLPDRDYTQWKGSKRYKDWASSGHPALLDCPLCSKESLFWNWRDKVYECLNVECRARGKSVDMLYRPHRVAYVQGSHRDTYTSKYYNDNRTRYAKSAEYKSPRRKLPLGKLFLILLIVACVVATIYTGYLLFTHRTNWGVGAIVLAADIGVLIWNISVLRKYRVGTGTVISILVVITLLGAIVSAFAGVEPFSDAKAEVVGWFQKVGSQMPTLQLPPVSKYPADIIGHVTIAEKVKCLTAIAVPPSRDFDVFWIIGITVKNNAYSDPVVASFQDCYKRWVIIASDKTFRPVACGSKAEPLSLAVGETGQFMLHFSMPETLHTSDAQICYQGQEPYSYGKLTGGDKVVAYDWGSKKVITEPKAVVEVENWKIQLDGKSWKGSTITVKLTITNLGPRRSFGLASLMDAGPELVVIDSTEKLIEPWVPIPDIEEMREGVMFYVPPYTREFYPNESWSGSLKFEMSPYSGETKLYMTRFYHQRKYFLFDLGSPRKD